MNTLEAETEIKATVQATEVVELIDCGRVSEHTRGFQFLIMFELGVPPLNTLLV